MFPAICVISFFPTCLRIEDDIEGCKNNTTRCVNKDAAGVTAGCCIQKPAYLVYIPARPFTFDSKKDSKKNHGSFSRSHIFAIIVSVC